MKIRLEPVTVASRAAVERLETAPGQEGFVESVAECLAEADRRRCWRPVGVYDGDALIGFAMYGFFWEYLPFGRLLFYFSHRYYQFDLEIRSTL